MLHPSSIISKEAEIAEDVVIGPFCVVRGRTRIGTGTKLESHVVIGNEQGFVSVGNYNTFAPGSVIGGAPQDLKYKGEPTRLDIGDHNIFRECCTVNIGTLGGGGVTRIGNQGLFMTYVHIAHDCQIGDHVVITNSGQLAGHVTIEDHVKVGGVCAFNQFVRVGTHAYIGGSSDINKDILPYTIANGRMAVMRAANKIGLERAGVESSIIDSIHRAVRLVIMGANTVEEALARIENEIPKSPQVEHFISFLKSSERGIAR